MKRTIAFHKAYLPTVIVSVVLIIAGIIGYIVNGGFNLGVDFQAGLMQEIQLAPTALKLGYAGKGVVSVAADASKLSIVVSGADVEGATFPFAFEEYKTLGDLAAGLRAVEGLIVETTADTSIPSANLIQNAGENPRLGTDPYSIHFLLPGAEPVSLETIRTAVAAAGNVSVQVLGKAAERKFLVRVQDNGSESGFAKAATERINAALNSAFGSEMIVVNRTDYVGARFSRNLTDQSGLLVFMTLVVILIYASIRFKPRYAFGAVLAILHDALIMVAFMAWSRMEFNTSSIAAILTILGYSINDTIVIFDRIREDVRLYPDESFTVVINRAVTETLGRTFITTLTTMLAVLSLFIFTTGSMKDFALALIIGMISGTYSTIFIASAFVNWWDGVARKRKIRVPKAPKATKMVVANTGKA